MISRSALILTAFGVLAACEAQIPDSVRGVGFDNSLSAQRARNEALAGQAVSQPQTVLPPEAALPSAAPAPGSPEATAAETQRVLDATRVDTAALPPEEPAVTPNNPTISDENDFDAVSGRQSIESDAERIAQNRARYTVIEPQAVPTRPGNGGPNIVAYALQTDNPRGEQLYPRTNFAGRARFDRNCAGYTSPDLAQIDFLRIGGPQRDRKGLDPDGDGFACAWDPEPFRRAARN